MKKRFIIGIIIIALLALVTSIILIISLNDEKDDENKDIISLEEFSSILIDFDTTNNMTITYSSSLDDEVTIMRNDKSYMIKQDNHDDLYYKHSGDAMFIYYQEDGKWKRTEYKADFKYNLKLNLKKYINSYSQFVYNHDTSIYELNEYIDDKKFENIKIKIEDNVVREYSYTCNDISYLYKISYYKNTTVELPTDYKDIYIMLTLDEFNTLYNSTENITNFTANIIYLDKIGDKEYETRAIVQRNDSNRQYQYYTSSNGIYKYYYEINNLEKSFYSFEDEEWKLIAKEATTNLSFNQKELIPLYLITSNYDKVKYNELDANYSLTDIEYNGIKYSEIIMEISDNKFTYFSMKYTYFKEEKVHNVTQIIEFKEFGKTHIDDIF